jgi:hypothetical protein
MRRQSATWPTEEQRQTGVLEAIVPLVLSYPHTIIAQTMAEIMAEIDLRESDTDPTAKSQRAGAMAHLNCSSTNHFLSLREQFLERPAACGGWPAGWGKLQCLGPPQLPFWEAENVKFWRRFIFLAVTA